MLSPAKYRNKVKRAHQLVGTRRGSFVVEGVHDVPQRAGEDPTYVARCDHCGKTSPLTALFMATRRDCGCAVGRTKHRNEPGFYKVRFASRVDPDTPWDTDDEAKRVVAENWRGMTIRDVAEVLGIGRNAAHHTLRTAIRKVRREYRALGWDETAVADLLSRRRAGSVMALLEDWADEEVA